MVVYNLMKYLQGHAASNFCYLVIQINVIIASKEIESDC